MLIPAGDSAGPFLVVALGFQFGLILFPLIFLSEAVTLWLFKRGAFTRALLDSLIVNVASSIVGALLLIALVAFVPSLNRQPSEPLEFFVWLLIPWMLSVLIESGGLLQLRRRPARQTWSASLAMNIASYVLSFVALFIWFTTRRG